MKPIILTAVMLSSFTLMLGTATANDGKVLIENSCMSCHGSEIYTRDNRKVKNLMGLQTQVEACNTQLGTGWFPEDSDAVVEYLNRQHYKLKK